MSLEASTVVPKGSYSVRPRMYHLLMFNRGTYLEHLYERSSIESAFSMVKGKLGAAVRSKSDAGQANEVLYKVLCHNICVLVGSMPGLGIEPAFSAGFPMGESC